MNAARDWADTAKSNEHFCFSIGFGGLGNDPGGFEELCIRFRARWTAQGWLAGGLPVVAVSASCWLGVWLATGTTGALGTNSGAGWPLVLGVRTMTLILKPMPYPFRE